MDIYVLDANFDVISVIDYFESCIWDIKYFEVGQFELYVPASYETISLLRKDRYLVRDKDMKSDGMYNVMIIKNIEILTDSEDGDHLIVTGYDLKSIASRRIVWSQTKFNGLVEMAIRRVITENIISPAIANRAIANVRLGTVKGYEDTFTQQVTGDNLTDYIMRVLNTFGLGWFVYVDLDKYIVFDLMRGLDRSIDQNENPQVLFSPDNENLLDSDYKLNTDQYKNVALVAGEGEGSSRKHMSVSLSGSTGLTRYETYVDARNIQSNDGEIDTTDYYLMLGTTGREKLDIAKHVETFSGDIDTDSGYVYGIDYNIGDIVSVTNQYTATAKTRIIGVVESNSSDGESVIPTFSVWE